MSETVVTYERFEEVRQRRRRVAAELALRPGSVPSRESQDGELPTIDCAPVVHKPSETRRQTAVVLRPMRP
jgi:hypothetical protein